LTDAAALLLDLGVPVDNGPGRKGPMHWAAQNDHPGSPGY
jgi:hypothetical protein